MKKPVRIRKRTKKEQTGALSPQKTPSALQLALASVQQKVKARPKPKIRPSPEQVAAEEVKTKLPNSSNVFTSV